MTVVTAVVPVKRLGAARSRLALPSAQRQDLALAFAVDTVEALVGCEAVVAWQPRTGVLVVPADLPCLRPADVAEVVGARVGPGGAFVPNRSGTGTTLAHHPGGRARTSTPSPTCTTLRSSARCRDACRAVSPRRRTSR